MIFHEFGDCTLPHIMLIHGGGNAWWNYLRQACVLARHYHVILPTLDGHGEECQTPYVSTERTADQLMDYIQQHSGGHLFALWQPDRDGAFDTEAGSYRKGHH